MSTAILIDPSLHMPTEQLPTATAEAIADAVVTRLQTASVTDRILTRAEAMRYTKTRSHAAFTAWAQRWQVRPTDRGRWSRAKLDLALAREAGQVNVPGSLRRKEAA